MNHRLKPFFMHPMVLLGEEAQVEAQSSLFGDSANLDARLVHGLYGAYDQKSIWMHPMELFDDGCHMESRFGPFGDSISFGAR